MDENCVITPCTKQTYDEPIVPTPIPSGCERPTVTDKGNGVVEIAY